MTESSATELLPEDVLAADLEAEQRAARIENQQRLNESSESTVA